MWLLIAELNDDGLPNSPVPFGPYDHEPTRDDVEAVYAWAKAKGYERSTGEAHVLPCRPQDAAERSAPSRFNSPSELA